MLSVTMLYMVCHANKYFQIKTLIKIFIKKQETINLVVVPCNVDIATTEALKMAQEVDPDGERTLGKKFRIFPDKIGRSISAQG